MIFSKLYNKLKKEQKEGLVGGLVCGLVWGLVWGLVVILINFSEALPFISGFYSILFLILGIILLSEILFWLSKKERFILAYF